MCSFITLIIHKIIYPLKNTSETVKTIQNAMFENSKNINEMNA